jgi:hypothetical protein
MGQEIWRHGEIVESWQGRHMRRRQGYAETDLM